MEKNIPNLTNLPPEINFKILTRSSDSVVNYQRNKRKNLNFIAHKNDSYRMFHLSIRSFILRVKQLL